jgi:hypothetical protein
MLTLKTSVAAAILVGTAALSAGAAYLVTKSTMQASVAVSCPAPLASTAPSAQSRAFPPLGNLPSTTGGKQW